MNEKMFLLVVSIIAVLLLVTTFYYYNESGNCIKNPYDLPDENGDTILRWAIHKNEPLFMQFLVENGADVNYRNNWNWTPLFWAVHYNNTDMVKYLLENGADVTIKDYENDTVIDYATFLIKQGKETNRTIIDGQILSILKEYK